MWKYRQAESFDLNGHNVVIGFCPQTQKLESPYETLSNTLALKGLSKKNYGNVYANEVETKEK